MAFKIKEGDTLPNLPFQFFQADGTTPLNVSTATTINIVIRTKNGTLLLKRPVTITDTATGTGIFDWAAGDTSVVGTFEYEFEITWNSGDIQTIPVDGYFELLVIDDIG